MIATVRHLSLESRRMHEGAWQSTVGVNLAGRTLGLLGLGRIGSRMAEYARVFGMPVIAWSQNLTDEKAKSLGAERVEKDDLFRRSDIVSIHVRLSDRTRGLVTARELALMKPGAYLINTSRGPIVVEADLLAALRAGKIAGAGLDVFDEEPPPRDASVSHDGQRHRRTASGLRDARSVDCILRRHAGSGRRLRKRHADQNRKSLRARASTEVGRQLNVKPAVGFIVVARTGYPATQPCPSSQPNRCNSWLRLSECTTVNGHCCCRNQLLAELRTISV